MGSMSCHCGSRSFFTSFLALGSELEALAFTTQHQRQEALAMSDSDSDSMPSLVSSSDPEDPDNEERDPPVCQHLEG